MDNQRQLNPFELKAEINKLILEFTDVNKLPEYIDKIQLLDAQNDKKTIAKLLYKELYNIKEGDSSVLCFLLERYTDKEELTKKLWELLRNDLVQDSVKIVAINFLRGLENNWELDTGNEILNEKVINDDTKKLLNSAIVNPEVQIDFLDFLSALSTNDKITLINSFANDYTNDELANILIPVFLSEPNSEIGLEALKILGESKSQLAFHALNTSLDYVEDGLIPQVKKSLSTLKIAGIREDNSKEFYKEILSTSKPYRCCITYPDGHGNQGLIFSRRNDNNRVQFVAIVIDDFQGIRDCFGFNDISQFECDKIIERFYRDEQVLEITIEQVKSVLKYAEEISKNSKNWLIPYEYVCWKNLLNDIEETDIKNLLETTYTKDGLTKNHFNRLLEEEFLSKWFLEYNYSDEFEEFINNNRDNFDSAIDKNINYIFYDDEKYVWSERILMCAYLEHIIGQNDIAQILFNLYYDEDLKLELFKNIIRKSIYEYYVNLKYNTEMNDGKYTLKELDKKIEEIERLWVCTK